jgi:hypothetical protein
MNTPNNSYRTPDQLKELLHNQEVLTTARDKTFEDLQNRSVINATIVEKALFRYTDLKCPEIAIMPSGLHAVFIACDLRQDTLLLVFRKKLVSTISYDGFYPFSVGIQDIAYQSLTVGIWLSLQYAIQFNLPWRLNELLKAYPDVTSRPGFDILFQKFGFEQLGYSPAVWKPPYNITNSAYLG